MDKIEQLRLKKGQAEQLLRNPLFEEIFERLKADLFEEWLKSDTAEMREFIFHRFNGLQKMYDSVQKTIRDYETEEKFINKNK